MRKKLYNDFAWECLRRNPQYISDWELFMKNTLTNGGGIPDDSEL
ncbi:transcriptional regulator domain-containing protein, partial [Yersinia pestis]